MEDVMSMEDIRATATRLNIDLPSLDLESIRLPAGENFGVISDDEDLKQEFLEYEDGFGNIIVVDNLPGVPKEKFEKVEGVIRKIYSQIGVLKEDGLWMPVNPDTQKTVGYCFIEFNSPQEAELAKEKTNGYKLDRSHIFSVNMFDDIEKFMKVPEEWAPPETKPYTPGSPEKKEGIAKILKKYSKKYEAEDQDVSMQLSEQDREKRRMLKEEWERWVCDWKRA